MVKLLISCGASPLDENKVTLFPFEKKLSVICPAWYDASTHSSSTRPLLRHHGVCEARHQPQEPQSQDRDDGDLNSIKRALNYTLIWVYNLDKNVDTLSPILISISKALHVAAFYGEEDIVRELMR